MEQKRTLWIVAAVGVFLLVVLGAAIILNSAAPKNEPAESAVQYSDEWLYPKSSTDENAVNGIEYTTDATGQTKNQTEYVEYDTNGNPIVANSNMSNISTPSSIEPLEPLATNTNSNSTGNRIDSTISSNKTTDEVSEQTGNMTVYSTNTNIYSSTPVTSNVQPTNAIAERAMTETASTNANQKASTATITPRPATTATAKTSSKTTTTTNKTSKKLTDQFWVQAASFTDKNRADAAREKLDTNKIQSEIFTYTDSNGKMYYRVRVGPYVTKSEAEYWQKRIAQVEGFTGSYVTNSSALKK